jgi:DNA-binding beta-propeller fold protein YncE
MKLRCLLLLLVLAVVLVVCTSPAHSEEVIEAWRGGWFAFPEYVSVNPSDDSCWVVNTGNNQVVHLSASGEELWRGDGFSDPRGACVNPSDGSFWMLDSSQAVHLAASGVELWRGTLYEPTAMCVNPTDGSVWVTQRWCEGAVVHLSANGTQLWRGGFACEGSCVCNPECIAVNPTDGSGWVGDAAEHQLVHFSSDGTELVRRWYYEPVSLSVDPRDGSCWVASGMGLFHVAEDGTGLGGSTDIREPRSVSVNPADGSCWVADTGNNRVVHLAADGSELWRGDGFFQPASVSVNPRDGSCWVADTWNGQVVHLTIPTTFGDVPYFHWAFAQIEACAEAQIVGGYDDGYHPEWAVSRDQMAVFISRALAGGDDNVPDGPTEATFNDVPSDFWAYKYVEYCVAQGVVGGYDPVTYGPTGTVSRDQMSVFISRAVAGGDENVPDGTPTATFDDVPTDHWAYKYVEYCVTEGVVGGYSPTTYAPTVTVTRDQMAVFISRAFGLGM